MKIEKWMRLNIDGRLGAVTHIKGDKVYCATPDGSEICYDRAWIEQHAAPLSDADGAALKAQEYEFYLKNYWVYSPPTGLTGDYNIDIVKDGHGRTRLVSSVTYDRQR